MIHRPPAGVQGEAVREKIRLVSHWLVRGQLVQNQRPIHQLYGGTNDGGCRGSCDH